MKLTLWCEDHQDYDYAGQPVRVRDLWSHWHEHRKADREQRARDAERAAKQAEWDALTPEEQQERRDAKRDELVQARDTARAYAKEHPEDAWGAIRERLAQTTLRYFDLEETNEWGKIGGFESGGRVTGGLMQVIPSTFQQVKSSESVVTGPHLRFTVDRDAAIAELNRQQQIKKDLHGKDAE